LLREKKGGGAHTAPPAEAKNGKGLARRGKKKKGGDPKKLHRGGPEPAFECPCIRVGVCPSLN